MEWGGGEARRMEDVEEGCTSPPSQFSTQLSYDLTLAVAIYTGPA